MFPSDWRQSSPAYFEPQHDEFQPRTLYSLANSFTSAFKTLEPVRLMEATAKLAPFLAGAPVAVRYAVIVILDTDLQPQKVIEEIVSTLEFDRLITVRYAVALTDDGEEVYAFKEEHPV